MTNLLRRKNLTIFIMIGVKRRSPLSLSSSSSLFFLPPSGARERTSAFSPPLLPAIPITSIMSARVFLKLLHVHVRDNPMGPRDRCVSYDTCACDCQTVSCPSNTHGSIQNPPRVMSPLRRDSMQLDNRLSNSIEFIYGYVIIITSEETRVSISRPLVRATFFLFFTNLARSCRARQRDAHVSLPPSLPRRATDLVPCSSSPSFFRECEDF